MNAVAEAARAGEQGCAFAVVSQVQRVSGVIAEISATNQERAAGINQVHLRDHLMRKMTSTDCDIFRAVTINNSERSFRTRFLLSS